MSIRTLRLKNFKSFADSQEIPLAPLTLILGRNNTGKSTILQSLLLLRQSLDTPGYGPRLNLSGPLYIAGTYADIVHQHKTSQNIEIDVLVGGTEPRQDGNLSLEFASDEPRPPRLVRCEISPPKSPTVSIRRGRGQGGPLELQIAGQRLGGQELGGFSLPANQFLPFIWEVGQSSREAKLKRDARVQASALLIEFDHLLRSMRAVGAFREAPKRRYEFQGLVSELIDPTGGNAVIAIIDDAIRRRKRRIQLLREVNRWLRSVGRVRLIPPTRLSKSGRMFEIRLRDLDSGRWASFADVGFGIGQAFPVIVEGLRTQPGSVFLVQEPEIHLHPDAQLAMADFLVSQALSGKQVIVETHSENILLRIRHLLLRATIERKTSRALTRDQVSVLFVDKKEDGTSQVQRLEFDALAQVQNWPRGFMEEATEERMDLLRSIATASETSG